MSNLIDKIYGQFTEEQLNGYQEQVTAALNRGIPKQMVFQYFLQAAYATLEELGEGLQLTQEEQNEIAVGIAHKLYMRATQDGTQSDDNSSAGT